MVKRESLKLTPVSEGFWVELPRCPRRHKVARFAKESLLTFVKNFGTAIYPEVWRGWKWGK